MIMVQADKNVELYEAVWQAWLKKNNAQDKFRFRRRLRVVFFVAVFLTVGTLLWIFTGSSPR